MTDKSIYDSNALTQLKQELIEVGHYLDGCGFHSGLAGNLSVRAGEDQIVCTRSGADKGALKNSDLVVCNMAGEVIEGEASATSELSMHLMAYRERSDVRSAIHAHPPLATAFAAASLPLDSLALPEMIVLIGPIALVPYATPGTEELALCLKPYLSRHDGFLLENHGALSVGKDLSQACQRMDLIEQNARITLTVRQLGTPFKLNPQQMQDLLDIRSRRAAVSTT
jgi:L-fuculose-phosphate aldolase